VKHGGGLKNLQVGPNPENNPYLKALQKGAPLLSTLAPTAAPTAVLTVAPTIAPTVAPATSLISDPILKPLFDLIKKIPHVSDALLIQFIGSIQNKQVSHIIEKYVQSITTLDKPIPVFTLGHIKKLINEKDITRCFISPTIGYKQLSVTGDGDCLFYTLSIILTHTPQYYNVIKVCLIYFYLYCSNTNIDKLTQDKLLGNGDADLVLMLLKERLYGLLSKYDTDKILESMPLFTDTDKTQPDKTYGTSDDFDYVKKIFNIDATILQEKDLLTLNTINLSTHLVYNCKLKRDIRQYPNESGNHYELLIKDNSTAPTINTRYGPATRVWDTLYILDSQLTQQTFNAVPRIYTDSVKNNLSISDALHPHLSNSPTAVSSPQAAASGPQAAASVPTFMTIADKLRNHVTSVDEIRLDLTRLYTADGYEINENILTNIATALIANCAFSI
jgi:hypothetical protein